MVDLMSVKRPSGTEEVRHAVLEAAARRFAAEGPDASLRQIAADADVNLGLIHRYIGNKDDLLRAVLSHGVEQGLGKIERATDASGALRDIFEASTVNGRYIRILAWLLLREPTHVEHQDRYPGMAALRALAGSSIDDPRERDAQLMAAMAAIYGWIVFGPRLRAAFDADDSDREELDQRIARVIGDIVRPA
jgi:AcrR family transcriptional regulator